LVSRLNIPIFVHITNIPVGYDALDADYNLNVLFTREVDNAANTIRLILGGVLSEFPDLKFVMSHLGEAFLPFWRGLNGTFISGLKKFGPN
jgi:predicted TIM-barrel fold metal-dependent hydrolase